MVSETSIIGSDVQEAGVSRIGDTVANRRFWLLHAVQNALVAKAISTGPGQGRPVELPIHPQNYRANGLEAVDRHLDRLLAAVRQPGVPQVAKVLNGICDGCEGCPQSAMVCPLRECGTCLILRDADTILHAIARALRVAKDPEYVQNHPVGL
jgi:hypothetical protein